MEYFHKYFKLRMQLLELFTKTRKLYWLNHHTKLFDLCIKMDDLTK